jgi:hypothetical protein
MMARTPRECKLPDVRLPRSFLTCFSAAGLKAALHNPNVSAEAKENVSHHLADLTSPPHTEATSTSHADDGKDPTRV